MRVRLLATLAATLLLSSTAMAQCGMFLYIEVPPQVVYVTWYQSLSYGRYFEQPPPPIFYSRYSQQQPPSGNRPSQPASREEMDRFLLGQQQPPSGNRPSQPPPTDQPETTDQPDDPPQQVSRNLAGVRPRPNVKPPAPPDADDLDANIKPVPGSGKGGPDDADNSDSGDKSDAGDKGDADKGDSSVTDLGLFEDPRQTGLIAWNGTKELLAIRFEEKTVTKGGYMSVMPLAGKPTGVKVKAGHDNMWNTAKNFFTAAFEKAGADGDTPTDLGLEGEFKVGAHEIFVWKIDNFKDFFSQIQKYLNDKYKGKVVPLIPKELEPIMQKYFKKGYDYFAFDMINATGKKETKQTILYEFETPKHELFYPLVISQSGGTGATAIDLLIVSDKEHLTYPDKSARSLVEGNFKSHFGKHIKAPLLPDQNVGQIAPELAQLFPGKQKVYARWYNTIPDTNIQSFKDDFRLKEGSVANSHETAHTKPHTKPKSKAAGGSPKPR